MEHDDRVTIQMADACRRLVELELPLTDAAAIQRGDRPVVIGRGRVRRFSARQLAAQRSLAEERLAAVDAERDQLVEQLDKSWLRRLGIRAD